MKRLEGYMAGANLGHWISQYGSKSFEHWSSYITEPDIARMKAWGLDHVRVPVDYFLFEKDERPGVYDANGLRYVDSVLEWCKANKMNMILDLHHAPGFFFGNGAKNDLFTNRESQKRFLNIWQFLANRYINEGDNLIFELLNELVWENSDPWNELWREAVGVIHTVSPERRIIVGGNHHNSRGDLKYLTVDPDERIIYTFHFYEPFIFTHQRAPWIEYMRNYTTPVEYPFKPTDHLPYFGGSVPEMYGGRELIGKEFIEHLMTPAIEFLEQTGKTLYCGEYGVIGYANNASAARWLSDVSDVLLEHGIGRAVWSYRGFSSITSPDNKSFDAAMVDAISRK